MTNNSLSHVLCLLKGSTFSLQEFQDYQPAVEFERHEGTVEILIRSADVVKEAGEEVCLVKRGR